jgi:oxygen-independent coproporphyrinogen III oxidase
MKDLSLYIHIPFCKSRCAYCGFLTFANKSGCIAPYIKALIKEIKIKAKKSGKYLIESVYIGGGTPSLIESKLIEQIICTIKKNFNIKTGAEITIECNPESVTKEKIRHYKKIGINRFSLGAQSLTDKILKRVGRAHDSRQIFEAVKILKREKIKNFGLDFIIGLPFQTLQSFKKELETILEVNPPHLSYYFLSPDTEQIKNFLSECPTEESQIKIYNHLIKRLKNEGFIHYEVSNYAKPGFECRHNLRYWNQQEYLGLGLGAHSYINGTVSENEIDLGKYIKNPVHIFDKYKLEPDVKRMDYIMLYLRTAKGINISDYERKYGMKEKKTLIKKAADFIKSEDLVLKNNQLYASEKGWLILDTITRVLL